MRGERHDRTQRRQPASGSSPHARGTLITQETSSHVDRFIPACAGNAGPPYRVPGSMAVHPRMRGERRSGHGFKNNVRGSSPHARGTLLGVFRPLAGTRFIPACAGNALAASRPTDTAAVHPRMRGERQDRAADGQSIGGSSPHARGTPRSGPRRRADRRFIPACAGNAWRGALPGQGRPVHPRMRGERRVMFFAGSFVLGSSPHARGTPHRPATGVVGTRFIPACAGNATGR